MWVSRAEMRRLLQQVAAAETRAQRAEDALAAERASKDWLTVQLASRVVTKHGQYGLDHAAPTKEPPPPAIPAGFTHVPDERDYAKLEWYKQLARQRGESEDYAEKIWEAEMRGEPLPYQVEVDGEQ